MCIRDSFTTSAYFSPFVLWKVRAFVSPQVMPFRTPVPCEEPVPFTRQMCIRDSGMGGPGYCIKGEFKSNGFNNDLRHTRGVLSMARTMIPDSAGSQFFIMHKDSPHLDGEYAAFGMVIEGMDVVDAIASTPRNMMTNKPCLLYTSRIRSVLSSVFLFSE